MIGPPWLKPIVAGQFASSVKQYSCSLSALFIRNACHSHACKYEGLGPELGPALTVVQVPRHSLPVACVNGLFGGWYPRRPSAGW